MALGSGCKNCNTSHNGLSDPQCSCECHEDTRQGREQQEQSRQERFQQPEGSIVQGAPKG